MEANATAERVALELLFQIAHLENNKLKDSAGLNTPDRKWLLDTYAECLNAVRNPEERST